MILRPAGLPKRAHESNLHTWVSWWCRIIFHLRQPLHLWVYEPIIRSNDSRMSLRLIITIGMLVLRGIFRSLAHEVMRDGQSTT